MTAAADIHPFRQLRSTRRARVMELLVLGLLIFFFIHATIQAIWRLRMDAERAEVMHTTGAIRSGLAMVVAEGVAKGKIDELARLHGSNPMHLLDDAHLPKNYRGRLTGEQAAAVAGYSWYFDPSRSVLVYRLGNPEAVETPFADPPRLEFRVLVRDNDGRVAGVELVSVAPFRWKDPEGAGDE